MTLSNVVNQVAYLRVAREFPEELHQLTVEIRKAYIDTANAINSRIISIFPVNRPAITGESWFITNNQKQQSLRRVYTFTAAGNILHEINTQLISNFTRCWGSFTDGTNWYGAIWGSNVAIAGQVSFYITSSNIVVLAGAGAPAITSGIIVLEWISVP